MEFTQWELRMLTHLCHEERNAMIGESSKIMLNKMNRLFDKVRFAEFEGRK